MGAARTGKPLFLFGAALRAAFFPSRLILMVEMLALAAFAGLLIYAACSDIARLSIPNWVSIAMAALFAATALFAGMSLPEFGLHLAVGAAVLGVGLLLFHASIVGGGDAKLLAAAALWTGSTAFAPLMFWTAAAGGALALALLAARCLMKQCETNPAFVNRLLKRQNGVPYGVAIMAGGLMALPALTGDWGLGTGDWGTCETSAGLACAFV